MVFSRYLLLFIIWIIGALPPLFVSNEGKRGAGGCTVASFSYTRPLSVCIFEQFWGGFSRQSRDCQPVGSALEDDLAKYFRQL